MAKFSEVQAIETELQSLSEDAIRTQNMTYLMEQGLRIGAWISFTGQEMANAKREWNEAKAKRYETIHASMRAIGDNYPPTIFKDYIAAKCSQEQYIFDSIERTHRSAERILDFLRTCISGLKAEINADMFHSNQRA